MVETKTTRMYVSLASPPGGATRAMSDCEKPSGCEPCGSLTVFETECRLFRKVDDGAVGLTITVDPLFMIHVLMMCYLTMLVGCSCSADGIYSTDVTLTLLM